MLTSLFNVFLKLHVVVMPCNFIAYLLRNSVAGIAFCLLLVCVLFTLLYFGADVSPFHPLRTGVGNNLLKGVAVGSCLAPAPVRYGKKGIMLANPCLIAHYIHPLESLNTEHKTENKATF